MWRVRENDSLALNAPCMYVVAHFDCTMHECCRFQLKGVLVATIDKKNVKRCSIPKR